MIIYLIFMILFIIVILQIKKEEAVHQEKKKKKLLPFPPVSSLGWLRGRHKIKLFLLLFYFIQCQSKGMFNGNIKSLEHIHLKA